MKVPGTVLLPEHNHRYARDRRPARTRSQPPPAAGSTFPEPGRPARVGVPGLLPRGQHPRRLPPRPAGWWRWCAGQDLDPLAVRRVHVDAYARGLEQQRRAAATVRRRLAVLSSFYRYAVAEGLLTVNPLAHVERPPADDVSTTLGLDHAEAARFLDAAEAAGPRDHTLACLLLLTGLRVTEALAADVDQLGADRGHLVLAITGKGG
jgi:integrase